MGSSMIVRPLADCHCTCILINWSVLRHRLLRKSKRFSWTSEAEEALAKLKALLTNPPILVPPARDEALLLYVAAMTQVVSAVVVVERQEEGHALPTQRPVYFISEVLSETKARYPHI